MAAPASIDAIKWLRKQIEETAPDPLKAMLVQMVELLMSAEVDAVYRSCEIQNGAVASYSRRITSKRSIGMRCESTE
jgi:hypothetical protein